MATGTQTTTTNQNESSAYTGTVIPFENINEPRCYVCNRSVHELRVPPDGVAAGRSPLVCITGQEQLFVTKLSDNAFIPVTKARMLACSHDINVNF